MWLKATPLLEDHALEGLDDLRVELGAGDAAQLRQRRLGAHRAPVGVARRHHVVGVRDGHDARAERDLLARDAGRVAAAGEPLVVVQDDLGDRAVALDALDELGALLGMELDQLPLVVGELAVRRRAR